jgi:hypothetical protein
MVLGVAPWARALRYKSSLRCGLSAAIPNAVIELLISAISFSITITYVYKRTVNMMIFLQQYVPVFSTLINLT